MKEQDELILFDTIGKRNVYSIDKKEKVVKIYLSEAIGRNATLKLCLDKLEKFRLAETKTCCQNYTNELLSALKKLDPDYDYKVYYYAGGLHGIPHVLIGSLAHSINRLVNERDAPKADDSTDNPDLHIVLQEIRKYMQETKEYHDKLMELYDHVEASISKLNEHVLKGKEKKYLIGEKDKDTDAEKKAEAYGIDPKVYNISILDKMNRFSAGQSVCFDTNDEYTEMGKFNSACIKFHDTYIKPNNAYTEHSEDDMKRNDMVAEMYHRAVSIFTYMHNHITLIGERNGNN